MISKTLTDPDGDSIEIWKHQSGMLYIAVQQDDKNASAGPFDSEALRSALDEVAPPAVAPETIESLTRQRDGAENLLREIMEGAAEDQENLHAEIARLRARILDPSDPDVIEQAAQRAYCGFWGLDAVLDHLSEDGRDYWRRVARAVLTPPPARPEGAEDWQEELDEMPAARDLTSDQRARLADALAERDRAIGVRVGGGEDA